MTVRRNGWTALDTQHTTYFSLPTEIRLHILTTTIRSLLATTSSTDLSTARSNIQLLRTTLCSLLHAPRPSAYQCRIMANDLHSVLSGALSALLRSLKTHSQAIFRAEDEAEEFWLFGSKNLPPAPPDPTPPPPPSSSDTPPSKPTKSADSTSPTSPLSILQSKPKPQHEEVDLPTRRALEGALIEQKSAVERALQSLNAARREEKRFSAWCTGASEEDWL